MASRIVGPYRSYRRLLPFRQFTRFRLSRPGRRQVPNRQTKPSDLGRESADRLLLSAFTIAIVVITQPVSWYSFHRPTEGERLSRQHCSKDAQPVPKDVYRNGCRDEHNRLRSDSNLGPDLQNILRQSYDYLTIMPKLRSTYHRRIIYKTCYEGCKAFLRYDSLAKL